MTCGKRVYRNYETHPCELAEGHEGACEICVCGPVGEQWPSLCPIHRHAPAHNADAALREAREALIGAIEKASKRFTEKGIIFELETGIEAALSALRSPATGEASHAD